MNVNSKTAHIVVKYDHFNFFLKPLNVFRYLLDGDLSCGNGCLMGKDMK